MSFMVVGSTASALTSLGGALGQDADGPAGAGHLAEADIMQRHRDMEYLNMLMGHKMNPTQLAMMKNKKKRDRILAERENNPMFGFLGRRFSEEDFQTDPGYQFRMEEGAKGLERGASARGGVLSGAAMKAMERYRQGVASDEYGKSYGRFRQDQGDFYNRASGNQMTSLNAQGQSFGQQQQIQANQNARKAGIANSLTDSFGQFAKLPGLGG